MTEMMSELHQNPFIYRSYKIFEDITPAKNSISPENYRNLTCGVMIIQLFKHNLKPRIRTILIRTRVSG